MIDIQASRLSLALCEHESEVIQTFTALNPRLPLEVAQCLCLRVDALDKLIHQFETELKTLISV